MEIKNIVIVLIFMIFFHFFKIIISIIRSIILAITKKKFLKSFLKEYNKLVNNYLNKETELIFHFQIINKNNELYNKMTIFNKEYEIEPNKPIRIKINEKNLIEPDITDYVSLSNSKSNKSFLITINLRQENHYQTFLDSVKNTNATEIVYYSKDKNIPNNLSAGYTVIKNFETEFIPRIKRFYGINVGINDIRLLFNYYSLNKLEEKKIINTDLFINLIENKDIIIGRIFEQKIEKKEQCFDENEINFLRQFEQEILNKQLFPLLKSLGKNNGSKKAQDIMKNYMNFLSVNNYNKIKDNVINKMGNICFFLKYFNKEPVKEEINIIETIIFLNFFDNNNIENSYDYIKQKNSIFNSPFEIEFSLKEKLFILIDIYSNIIKDVNAKLVKLYELPETSPYFQSELLYRNVIMNLTYDSSLYFFFLQLNSNCDYDMISSNSWFKIKKISLIEIQNHLLSDFSPYFFTFNSGFTVAFTNPQTLLKSYNENKTIGYFYFDNFAETESLNNTMKLFFIKIHEESHFKFKGGYYMKNSGRFLLDYDLKVIDSHFYSIKKDSKLEDNVGKDGYAAEIYILDNYTIIDDLLSSKEELQSLFDIHLYAGKNFNKLKEEILTKIYKGDTISLKEKFENSKNIKNEKERTDNGQEMKLVDIFSMSIKDGFH